MVGLEGGGRGLAPGALSSAVPCLVDSALLPAHSARGQGVGEGWWWWARGDWGVPRAGESSKPLFWSGSVTTLATETLDWPMSPMPTGLDPAG